MKRLNLGCGELKKDGYINLDWQSLVKPDVLHDLNVFPYPFDDNAFDEIEASHILEHLNQPFEVMKELHRILKPGGKLLVKVPHFSRGMTHSEHTHGFDVTFPLYFDKNYTRSGFVGVEFKLDKMEFHWLSFFHLMFPYHYSKFLIETLKSLNKAISFLANLNQNFCSRIWCYWVGGFDEIEFHFTSIKETAGR